ncbi:SAV_6107 family HEPN domain-containing protein [Gordonia sp. PKS22-38]|uniref:SAV_6107 family HEPN domain-containing protein n=1 Tax=Gordonia prachuapensis TaxID=3115651 RepID=A0ABU7MS98_9ACTN|nr:SAV_6107 family HEPN domain-containing protein [Gordonia sp. PKS22-38]
MPSSIRSPRSTADVDPIVVRRSRDLLDRAHVLFDNADGVTDSAERFRQFYLTALRAAGAVLEIHEPSTRPARRRHSRSAWNRLPVVIPALAEHADFFAARSHLRLDIESGLVRAVDDRVVAQTRSRVIGLLDDVEELLIAYEQGKSVDPDIAPDRSA